MNLRTKSSVGRLLFLIGFVLLVRHGPFGSRREIQFHARNGFFQDITPINGCRLKVEHTRIRSWTRRSRVPWILNWRLKD